MINKATLFPNSLNQIGSLKRKYNNEIKSKNHEANFGTRAVYKIADTSNKALYSIAIAISALVFGTYDIISLPFRLLKAGKNTRATIIDGANLIINKNIKSEIVDYIREKNIKFEDGKENEAIEMALASYGRSQHYYGPLAVKWADYLLDKANQENKKLIFLARDGTVIYKLALKMLKQNPEKYPNLSDDKLQLAYFSRKVMNTHSKENPDALIIDYVKQLGIDKHDSLIFVDVGFEGSMIEAIKRTVKVPAEFEYFISLTNNAHGFIASKEKPLKSVPSAGGNPAMHWLEDSHQGVIKSPERLESYQGRVYPNTLLPGRKETYISDPKQYLIRKWSFRAIKNASEVFKPELVNKEKAIGKIEELFASIRRLETVLFIKH